MPRTQPPAFHSTAFARDPRVIVGRGADVRCALEEDVCVVCSCDGDLRGLAGEEDLDFVADVDAD